MSYKIRTNIIQEMDLDISFYLYKCLKHNNITTLDELADMSYKDLRMIMPKRKVIEALDMLNNYYRFKEVIGGRRRIAAEKYSVNNKSVGMVHIPGVNDKAYKAFKDAQKPNVITFNPNLNQW
jgi:hypothetical protein